MASTRQDEAKRWRLRVFAIIAGLLALLGIGLIGLMIWGAMSFSAPRTLSGADCRPRKLVEVEDCRGQDTSFQECRFYFRATGRPDPAWCRQLASQARTQSDSPERCDLSQPGTWGRADCGTFGLPEGYECYECCPHLGFETRKCYVYAYERSCRRGIEQVTCNYDPKAVGRALEGH